MDRETAEKCKILEIPVGSILYGTDTLDSDQDFSGVLIAPREYYFGLNKIEEIDLSVTSKLESGRNSAQAVDRKFYEIRKFITLAMENNPNIIEQLFCPRALVKFSDNLGEKLLDHAHIFPHKGAQRRFIGYAMAQKKKIMIKKENFEKLEEAAEVFSHLPDKTYVAEHRSVLEPSFSMNADTVHIGDIHIQNNVFIEKAKEQIADRIAKFGSRKALVDEFGYDVKFASHLIRLLSEGRQLLLSGRIEFPLRCADLIKDIKKGKYSLGDIENMCERMEEGVNEAFDRSPLPAGPRFNDINKLLMQMVEDRFTKPYSKSAWGIVS